MRPKTSSDLIYHCNKHNLISVNKNVDLTCIVGFDRHCHHDILLEEGDSFLCFSSDYPLVLNSGIFVRTSAYRCQRKPRLNELVADGLLASVLALIRCTASLR